MNYVNRVGAFLLPVLVVLLPLVLTAPIAVAQSTDTIRDEGEAALNAVDICKDNASRFLREDRSRLLVTTNYCAEFTYAVLAALRAARHSPEGYNLHNGDDYTRFMENASTIVLHDEEALRIAGSIRQLFPDSVLETIFQGSVGAYIFLDYGIDPRTL